MPICGVFRAASFHEGAVDQTQTIVFDAGRSKIRFQITRPGRRDTSPPAFRLILKNATIHFSSGFRTLIRRRHEVGIPSSARSCFIAAPLM